MPSSVIKKFFYNEEEEILTIIFVSDKVYRYLKVPVEVYSEFQSAFSKGVYFNQHIKDRFDFEEEP